VVWAEAAENVFGLRTYVHPLVKILQALEYLGAEFAHDGSVRIR
jgi:hypothetical protein